MKKALVAYTTNSGSTEDIARRVSEELGKNGAQVELNSAGADYRPGRLRPGDRWRADDPWLASFRP